MRLKDIDSVIERMDYPTTSQEIIDSHGAQELSLANGSETVRQVFNRCGMESFTTADEARLTLYSSVSEGAIGRKGYSDRDPPMMFGEVEHVSF